MTIRSLTSMKNCLLVKMISTQTTQCQMDLPPQIIAQQSADPFPSFLLWSTSSCNFFSLQGPFTRGQGLPWKIFFSTQTIVTGGHHSLRYGNHSLSNGRPHLQVIQSAPMGSAGAPLKTDFWLQACFQPFSWPWIAVTRTKEEEITWERTFVPPVLPAIESYGWEKGGGELPGKGLH